MNRNASPEVQEHMKNFLANSWRTDPESQVLLSPGNQIFNFSDGDTSMIKIPDFKSTLTISENSSQRSKSTSASFGVEASYGAFSGAASASLTVSGGTEQSSLYVNHNLYANKWKGTIKVFEYAPLLRPEVVNLVKKRAPADVVKHLGHFFATSVTIGGHMQLTRVVKKKSSDSALSIRSEVKASYGMALVSVTASASASHAETSHMSGREESTTLSVRGGDVAAWLAYDGKNMAECQTKWASNITDDDMHGLDFELRPLWEAFEEHPDLKDQAAALKKYIKDEWARAEKAVQDALNKKPESHADSIYMEKGFKQKCGIRSIHFNQWMFVSGWKYNTDRKYALFWNDTNPTYPESADDMHFEIVGYGDYAGIRNVKAGEWLYAGSPKYNTDRTYVLSWGKTGNPEKDTDMRWYIKDFGGYVGLKNILNGEWMYCGPELKTDRRHAVTWGRTGAPNLKGNEDMKMQIKIITTSRY